MPLIFRSVIRESSMDIDDRYARHRLIDGWDQERLRAARVMVAGAGAIGNEVIKLLALLGIGRLLIVDFDSVEISNLTRSPLFREADIGRSKAFIAAERAKEEFGARNKTCALGKNLACHGQKRITREQRQPLGELAMVGRATSTEVVIVHAGQVIMNEREAVVHLERDRRGKR